MAISKVVFPVPPPTTNTLSYEQRAHLMRKTRKLANVLGTHPRLLDDTHVSSAPVYLDFPIDTGSRDSLSLRESLSSTLYSGRSVKSHRRSTSTSSTRSSFEKLSKSSMQMDYYNDRMPTLRLSSRHSSASPLPSSVEDLTSDTEEDKRYTIVSSPDSARSPRDSLIAPSFMIPSMNTLRRQKMDRLRRKLGDGVPLDMVFRGEWAERDNVLAPSASLKTISENQEKEKENIGVKPTLRPIITSTPITSRNKRSINSARDSISLSSSPHRAIRIKRKPVPLDLEATRPAPAPPLPKPSLSVETIEAKKKRLSLIAESPDEPALFTTVASAVACLGPRSSCSDDDDQDSGYGGDSPVYAIRKPRTIRRKPPPSPVDYESSDSEMYHDWWLEYSRAI